MKFVIFIKIQSAKLIFSVRAKLGMQVYLVTANTGKRRGHNITKASFLPFLRLC